MRGWAARERRPGFHAVEKSESESKSDNMPCRGKEDGEEGKGRAQRL